MTSAPSVIHDLVERFDRNRDSYVSATYNEAQLRREFLDPFFKALGWDVDNEAGLAEKYKDVVHEDSIRVTESEALKAPDYCFRVGGTRKFFVEAKKPSVYIQGDSKPAFQIRRYAWSAKLPLSILTNFEEFAVYDCRVRPAKDDKSSAARILFLPYTDYLAKWNEIAAVFSKDAVLKGSFDRYAESVKGKKGTAEVDTDLLREIESWREELAHNIALRNPDLTIDELNTAVSRTIDRILFLRVCEDRGTEQDEQLKSLLKGTDAYRRLFELFHRADERYNSGLFHFSREAGREEEPDKLTPKLKVDDTPLKGIIRSLYYPDCPYVWSQIPADILGQVYEQFLGKVIRLTKGHQAKVEDKPEVKKAGGVYYTPTYIVDYIVQHTVGKLLEGKTPKETAKLRILDPACGSGSFLIGAYQYLLDWYLEQYVNSFTPPTPPSKLGGKSGSPPSLTGGTKGGSRNLPIYQAARGVWRLTLAERKRILLDHIYGVDIDGQAVEVTKLSLLLKVLEGETQDTLQSELKLRIRALPDLGANIKCGNSLIGTDFYEFVEARGFKGSGEARGFSPLSKEEIRRINPFDWHEEFPHVFPPVRGGTKGGRDVGFDAVIGNPPYLKIEHIPERDRAYFFAHYASCMKRFDSFGLFVERALGIVKAEAINGFIIPSTILNNLTFKTLRQQLVERAHVREIVNLGGKVFRGVNNDTIIITYSLKTQDTQFTEVYDVEKYGAGLDTAKTLERINLAEVAVAPEYVISIRVSAEIDMIRTRMFAVSENLGSLCESFQGFVTGGNDAFIVDDATVRKDHLEKKMCRPAVFGNEVARYGTPAPNWRVLFLTKETKLNELPNIKKRLSPYKPMLSEKREVKLGRQPWYAMHWPRNESIYLTRPKILVQAIRNLSLKRRIVATIDDSQLYADHTLNILCPKRAGVSMFYVLGLLNSALMNFIFSKVHLDINIKGAYLEDIAIRTINISDKQDKARHDKMVSLVEKMLELNKDLPKARTEAEQTRLKRQIAATDRQIDQLVYELYGLTEEEIAIVEGSEKKT